jgi:hypothetical protein
MPLYSVDATKGPEKVRLPSAKHIFWSDSNQVLILNEGFGDKEMFRLVQSCMLDFRIATSGGINMGHSKGPEAVDAE